MLAAGCAAFALAACASAPVATRLDADPEALARAMSGHAVVLLGEVHDNAEQHRLRFDALRLLMARGARPALAFEQFDAERQHDIDRLRADHVRDAQTLIDHIASGQTGWDWAYYRPYVQLALDLDLPIVAANLSRPLAARVAREGFGVVFDATTIASLGLDHLSAALLAEQRVAVDAGHCGTLPPSALDAVVQAQIARDIVLARALQPYEGRGVVLLTGNGHVRRDVGVPVWLRQLATGAVESIGLLEEDDDLSVERRAIEFDAYVVTARAQRPDPCARLRGSMTAGQ